MGFLLLLAVAATRSSWWGLHFFRYLGATEIALVGALTIGAALIGLPAARTRWSRWAPIVQDGLLAVGAGAMAWGLRDRAHLLGDGTVLLDHARDPLTYHNREPLGSAVFAAVSRAAETLALPYATAYELFSVLLGVGLVLLVARVDRAVQAHGVLLLLGLVHGGLQLWFGYIEFYPPMAFVVVAALIAARPMVSQRAPMLPFLLLMAIAVMLHISAISLVPMALWCVVRQFLWRTDVRGRALAAAEIVGAGVLALGIWAAVWSRVDAPSLPEYLSILTNAGDFTYGGEALNSPGAPGAWSTGHLAAFANQVWLLSAVSWIVTVGAALFLFRRKPDAMRADPWIAPLAVASVTYLVGQFQFFPSLGAPRDWDPMAVAAFPIGLLAARLVSATGWIASPPMIPFLAALSVLHVAPWILVNANPEAAHERFAEMPMHRGQATYVLAVRALKAGQVEEATRQFETLVQEMPTSVYAWRGLGLARDAAGDTPRALQAYQVALSAQLADPRVTRTELLEHIGQCQWRLGDPAEAARTFQAVLSTDPESVKARIFLAVTAAGSGDHARVWELLEPALPHRAESPAILVLSARALTGLGRDEEALPLIQAAEGLFPDDPAVRALRGAPRDTR